MQKIPRRDAIFLFIIVAAGCSYPGEKQEDARRIAAEAYDKAQKAFTSKDYAAAETSLTEAINAGGLNPDLLVDATVKRAVCWGATGKPVEAIESLQQIESWGEQQDLVFAARAYVLAKQGKLAESRAALAKARQYNRMVHEFKD
jgi:Tfp pilus assembly protein PilF